MRQYYVSESAKLQPKNDNICGVMEESTVTSLI